MRGRGASQLSQLWGGVQRKEEGARVSLVSFGGGCEGAGARVSFRGAQRGRGASRSSMALPGSARVVCPAGWFEVRFLQDFSTSVPLVRVVFEKVPQGFRQRFHHCCIRFRFRPCRTWWNPQPYIKPRRTLWNLVERWWNPGGTLVEPSNHPGPPLNRGGTLVEPWWNLASNHPGPPRSPRRTLERWWNFRGTLPQTTPRPSRSPCRTWWNPVWNPRLVDLTSNHPGPPRRTYPAEFGGTLVELSWNLSRTPVWNPRLVEPYIKPPPHRTWWNPGGTLVEPWWNPGGTLVEPWWNLGGTLPQTTADHHAALAEPGGTLVETLVEPCLKPPRTTPQPSHNLVEPW